jgi:hypothetical protein
MNDISKQETALLYGRKIDKGTNHYRVVIIIPVVPRLRIPKCRNKSGSGKEQTLEQLP